MHVQLIPIVWRLSTSGSDGLQEAHFSGAPSTPSHRLQMDIFGSELTRVCSALTGLLSAPFPSRPFPLLLAFQYCNYLQMLTDNCGSVHREPMSSARTMANLRASDMAQTYKPLRLRPSRKTTRGECWFPISPMARSVSREARLRK